ncbi:uncharacterized protein LOC103517221 isoform X2 [Diaphorina citri]|uniref:Uncharacterized protein LOC103517221 isoform X2 n=1 Tax=Diaphorina citri TaxID=121845 RepID=A0A3Q0J9M4_DIACI|nr:uncharacterized protein LOC103517221 isoform X2 [Diaphorina citri]
MAPNGGSIRDLGHYCASVDLGEGWRSVTPIAIEKSTQVREVSYSVCSYVGNVCAERPFSQNMNKMWKRCFVPKCVNTTTRTPDKLFITLPSNFSIKKKWFKQARRPYNTSDKSTLYACEDHFDYAESRTCNC